MDGRTLIAGYRLQDTDTDMDRRTWIARLVRRTGIAGHGHVHELKDMDMDMDCRTWTRSYEHAWCLHQKEFKSHQYIVYPV